MESQLFVLGGVGAVIMGAMLGLFGAGGSILTVPLLTFIFGIAPLQATHYSLLVVGAVSAFGVIRERKSGTVPLRDLVWFAGPAMAGMFLVRREVMPALPRMLPGGISLDRAVLILFAVFMIIASISMIFVKVKAVSEDAASGDRRIGLGLIGFMIGAATGFVGAGGGFLIVPTLLFFARMPVREAMRASLLVIMLNSLWGFFSTPVIWSSIPWTTLGAVILAAFAGISLGLWGKKRLPVERLKPAFGFFVLVLGTGIIWTAL